MNSAQVPTLIYFDCRGTAEVTRQMFNLAGVQFEDMRINFSDLGEMKATGKLHLPFGQLPILKTVEGVTICQVNAIQYYVAKKYGFLGSNLLEETRSLMISNCVADIILPLCPLYSLKGEDFENAKSKYENEKLDDFLNKLTALLKENSSNSMFFIGKKLSLADLVVSSVIQLYETHALKYEQDKYPALIKLYNHIMYDSDLKDYIKNRPKTQY